jgi:GH24 family phage-related lysozyme (muramidase)
VADEGEVLFVYKDSRGYDTLGVGRRVDKLGGISKAESRFMLQNDIVRIAADCQRFPWFGRLDPIRQAVILSMAFVFGINGLQGWPNFLNLCAVSNWSEASSNLMTSKWHGEAPERVYRLAQQLLTGQWV